MATEVGFACFTNTSRGMKLLRSIASALSTSSAGAAAKDVAIATVMALVREKRRMKMLFRHKYYVTALEVLWHR